MAELAAGTPGGRQAAVLQGSVGSEPRRRVLFLACGGPTRRVGGAVLRHHALRTALAAHAEVTALDLACPQLPDCPHRPGPVPSPQLPVLEDPFWWWNCPQTTARVQQAVQTLQPDVAVVSGIEACRYLLAVSGISAAQLVFDLHNVDSELFADITRQVGSRPRYGPPGGEQFWTPARAEAVRRVERLATGAASRLWVCTEQDRLTVSRLHGVDPAVVTVVPNAVQVPAAPQLGGRRPDVLFLGRLDWPPNLDAAEFLLDHAGPLLAERAGWARVVVAGASPSPALVDRPLPANAVLVADPADLSPLWRSSVLAVPLRVGGGSRLKILEAFAVGCPVISSAKGIEGIDAEPGRHYLAAESAEELAEAVVMLHRHPAARDDLARAAHALVRDRYSWQSLSACVGADVAAASSWA